MRGLALASVALLLAPLSGCLADTSDKYFPPASDLPDGLVPVATNSSEWKLAAPFLGMFSRSAGAWATEREAHRLGRAGTLLYSVCEAIA